MKRKKTRLSFMSGEEIIKRLECSKSINNSSKTEQRKRGKKFVSYVDKELLYSKTIEEESLFPILTN